MEARTGEKSFVVAISAANPAGSVVGHHSNVRFDSLQLNVF